MLLLVWLASPTEQSSVHLRQSTAATCPLWVNACSWYKGVSSGCSTTTAFTLCYG